MLMQISASRRRFAGAALSTFAALALLSGCDNRPAAAPAPPKPPEQTPGLATSGGNPASETPAATADKPPVDARLPEDSATPAPAAAAAAKPPTVKPLPGDKQLRTWLARRTDPNPQIREQAEAFLEGREEGIVELLLAGMQDSDAAIRAGAAFALAGRMDLNEERQVQAFLAALDDRDSNVRKIVLGTVGQWEGARLLPGVSYLTKILADTGIDKQQRALAARALGKVGRLAPGSYEALAKAVRSAPEKEVRLAAVSALAEAASEPRDAVPVLAEVLAKDDDPFVRRQAALQLGNVGLSAAAALQELAAAARDRDVRVAKAAIEALAFIGSASVPALQAALQAKDKEVRIQALASLEKLGPLAKDSLPAVLPLSRDADPEIRAAAQAAALEMGRAP